MDCNKFQKKGCYFMKWSLRCWLIKIFGCVFVYEKLPVRMFTYSHTSKNMGSQIFSIEKMNFNSFQVLQKITWRRTYEYEYYPWNHSNLIHSRLNLINIHVQLEKIIYATKVKHELYILWLPFGTTRRVSKSWGKQ